MVVADIDRKSQAYVPIMHLQAMELTRKKAKKTIITRSKNHYDMSYCTMYP